MEGTFNEPASPSDDELLPDALPLFSPASASHDYSDSHSTDQSNDQHSAFAIDSAPGQFKLRGRKIGDGAGSKRKAEKTLSDNPHTKRARARKEQMTETEQHIDRAKNADRQARTRVRKKVMNGNDYLSANEADRQRLLDTAEAKEMSKRHTLGRSGTALAAKLGYGEEGGLYADWDDANNAWEDEEDAPDDPFYEKRVQSNDLENKEKLPTDMDIRKAKGRSTLQQDAAAVMARIQFKHWSRFWRRKLKKYHAQLIELSRRGEIQHWDKGYFDLRTNRIHEIEPPHLFFGDPAIRAIFRNMGSWLDEARESSIEGDIDHDIEAGWYTLPGPAEWWSDQYDYEAFGFDIEAGSSEKYERAFDMMFETTQPEAFKWVLPGIDELMVLSHTRETEVLLQFFG